MTHWRAILRENFTDWRKLISFLELEEKEQARILKDPKFPLNLPKRLAEKIEKKNINDPILRQFLPLIEEKILKEGFILDPVGDASFLRKKKLLHKYQGRALLLCTSACAMHCRFCFRQNFDYEIANKLFCEELEEIQNDSSLTEIILSGGDPLSLSDEILDDLLMRLGSISHMKRVRIHTRFPMGIPERLDDSFLQILEKSKLQIYFVIHANHPREFDDMIWQALKNIRRLGIPILNQTVLLKGVNDDLMTLKELFEGLIDHGILPYYLHQLDRVEGTTHFEVTEREGMELIEELKRILPGYGVPKYVRELPGFSSKIEISHAVHCVQS